MWVQALGISACVVISQTLFIVCFNFNHSDLKICTDFPHFLDGVRLRLSPRKLSGAFQMLQPTSVCERVQISSCIFSVYEELSRTLNAPATVDEDLAGSKSRHFHSVIYSDSNDAENYFIRAPVLNDCWLLWITVMTGSLCRHVSVCKDFEFFKCIIYSVYSPELLWPPSPDQDLLPHHQHQRIRRVDVGARKGKPHLTPLATNV